MAANFQVIATPEEAGKAAGGEEIQGRVALSPAQTDFIEDRINAQMQDLRDNKFPEGMSDFEKQITAEIFKKNPDIFANAMRMQLTGSTVPGYASPEGAKQISEGMAAEGVAETSYARELTPGEKAGEQSLPEAAATSGHSGGYYGGSDAFALSSPKTPAKGQALIRQK